MPRLSSAGTHAAAYGHGRAFKARVGNAIGQLVSRENGKHFGSKLEPLSGCAVATATATAMMDEGEDAASSAKWMISCPLSQSRESNQLCSRDSIMDSSVYPVELVDQGSDDAKQATCRCTTRD